MKYSGYIDGLLTEAVFAKKTGDASWLRQMLDYETEPVKRMLLEAVCNEQFLSEVQRNTAWINEQKTRLEYMAIELIEDGDLAMIWEQMEKSERKKAESEDKYPGSEEEPCEEDDSDDPGELLQKEPENEGVSDERADGEDSVPEEDDTEGSAEGESPDSLSDTGKEDEEGEGTEDTDEDMDDGENGESEDENEGEESRQTEKEWEKMRQNAMRRYRRKLERQSMNKAMKELGENLIDEDGFRDLMTGGGADTIRELENRVLSKIPRSLKRLARMIGRTGGFDIEPGKSFSRAAKSDIAGITVGDDLNSLLPSEIALLSDGRTQDIFYKNYAEKRLQVFASASSGEKKTERHDGPVIICLDTSGSMTGEPAAVARMLTVAVAIYAMRQRRKVLVIKYSDDYYAQAFTKRRADRERLMRFLNWCGSGGNDESKMFRFLFQEFLPQEPAFESADVLCISDFMWPFLDNDVKQSIQKAKVDGMKFYGLVVSHRGYCEYVKYQGELDSLQMCDSKWVWTGEECVEV